MIELDPIIVDFVSKNAIALWIAREILAFAVRMTPWTWDDALPGFFNGLMGRFHKTPKPPVTTQTGKNP